jgi:hypothetical protein
VVNFSSGIPEIAAALGAASGAEQRAGGRALKGARSA